MYIGSVVAMLEAPFTSVRDLNNWSSLFIKADGTLVLSVLAYHVIRSHYEAVFPAPYILTSPCDDSPISISASSGPSSNESKWNLSTFHEFSWRYSNCLATKLKYTAEGCSRSKTSIYAEYTAITSLRLYTLFSVFLEYVILNELYNTTWVLLIDEMWQLIGHFLPCTALMVRWILWGIMRQGIV